MISQISGPLSRRGDRAVKNEFRYATRPARRKTRFTPLDILRTPMHPSAE